MAQDVAPGPIPLAAHAAEGLQQLLNLIAASQNVTPDHADRLAGPVTGELRAARQSLVDAIGNVNILLNLLDAISWQRSAPMNSRRPPRSRRRAAPGHCRHEHQPATNPVLHQAIMDIVDNQLRDNTPPETRRTFERLGGARHTPG